MAREQRKETLAEDCLLHLTVMISVPAGACTEAQLRLSEAVSLDMTTAQVSMMVSEV